MSGHEETGGATGSGVEGVTVDLGGTRALDNVSISLTRGQISVVVGGDGAGKTTLIEVLAGRIIPSAGRVSHPDRRLIGYQSAASGVWLDLTVQENLDFVAASYHVPATEARERTQELVELAGLGGAVDRLGRELSGGMRQKLGFIMAMLHGPELVLLDEPTTGVDPVSRVELWRMIAQAAAAGAAVLMATTYLDEAERAQQVLILDRGRSLGCADPDQILAEVPGVIAVTDSRPATENSWRRGRRFHAWYPPGADARGTRVDPDMEDAVIALSLAQSAKVVRP